MLVACVQGTIGIVDADSHGDSAEIKPHSSLLQSSWQISMAMAGQMGKLRFHHHTYNVITSYCTGVDGSTELNSQARAELWGTSPQQGCEGRSEC